MKVFTSTLAISLLLIAPIISTGPIPRYGTVYYDDVYDSMTPAQHTMFEESMACYNVEYSTPIAYDDSVLNHKRMDKDGMLAFITTPRKMPGHQRLIPMMTFASFYGSKSMEICTRAGAHTYDKSDATKMAANYMFNNEDFYGSYQAHEYVDGPYSINVALDLDVRSSYEYAFVGGIMHMRESDTWATSNWDTLWIQSFGYESKSALAAWTDISENRKAHESYPVIISLMALPTTTGNNKGIDPNPGYQAGKVLFHWPNDTAVHGGCIDVEFNSPFEYNPYVFSLLEHNMNTESIGLSSWIEDSNENGARICISTLAYLGSTKTARILRENQPIYIHYAAFNNPYSSADLASSTPPAHCRLTATNIGDNNSIDSNGQAFLTDLFKIAGYTTAAEFSIKKFTHTNGMIEMYFDDPDGHYFSDGSEKMKNLSLDAALNKDFIEKYKASNETKFEFNFAKYPVYGPYEAGTCSVNQCSTDGGTMTIKSEAMNTYIHDPSNNNVAHPREATVECNRAPCEYKTAQWALLFNNVTNEYKIEKIEYPIANNNNNTGLIIGIIVAIVVVAAIGCFVYFYMKGKGNKAKSSTTKTSAFRQLV